MGVVEHGFTLFSETELDTGIKYAAEKDKVTLDRTRLRTIANNAGKTRINTGRTLTPRDVAVRAAKAFNREFPGSKLKPKAFDGYVHAIAKMFSERNAATRAKRFKEKEAQEIVDALHNIDSTPDIDPKINRQLALGLTGSILDEEADVP